MRLTHITIENFKGIRDRVEIPLRPITLLFGANSAGKSTMLQAMLYLRELLERQNADADVVGGGGDVINLGGFRQMVHGHDLARKLTVGATVALDDDGLPRSLEVKECNAATEELHRGVSSIRAVSVEIEVEWCPDYAIPVIAALRVKADDESILEIRQERLDRPKLWLNEAHPALEEVLAGALGEQFPHLQDVIQGPTMILDQTTVIPAWHDPLTGYFPGEESEPELAGLPALLPIISRLALGAGRAVLSQLQSIRYIGPMREFPARSATAQRTPDGGRWASGLAAWDWLAKDIDDEKHSDEVARLDQWLTSKDHLDLGYSVRIVASRELPEESELNLMLRALRRSSEPEELALRIKALVDSDLLAQPVLRRVVITDLRNGAKVDAQDVGNGVTQVIPVVAGVLAPGGGTLAVEQPELHLHPAIQCRLADVFVRALHLGRDRLFLIETHSEHLMLRLMRRIRETSEDTIESPEFELTKDDLQVLYVESYEGRTVFRQMPLNNRGEWVKEWPGGFFDEDLDELF